jgi:hypothetical protein
MRLDDRARRELLGAGPLKRLLVGTVLATLLLGAQEGGKPWHAACWVIVGAILATLTEAYGTHLSRHRDDRVRDYFRGLVRSVVYESIFVVAALPTVLFLVLAATFHWRDDHQNSNGSWSVGYTTIGLNMNVVLLFIGEEGADGCDEPSTTMTVITPPAMRTSAASAAFVIAARRCLSDHPIRSLSWPDANSTSTNSTPKTVCWQTRTAPKWPARKDFRLNYVGRVRMSRHQTTPNTLQHSTTRQ